MALLAKKQWLHPPCAEREYHRQKAGCFIRAKKQSPQRENEREKRVCVWQVFPILAKKLGCSILAKNQGASSLPKSSSPERISICNSYLWGREEKCLWETLGSSLFLPQVFYFANGSILLWLAQFFFLPQLLTLKLALNFFLGSCRSIHEILLQRLVDMHINWKREKNIKKWGTNLSINLVEVLIAKIESLNVPTVRCVSHVQHRIKGTIWHNLKNIATGGLLFGEDWAPAVGILTVDFFWPIKKLEEKLPRPPRDNRYPTNIASVNLVMVKCFYYLGAGFDCSKESSPSLSFLFPYIYSNPLGGERGVNHH